MRKYGVLFCLLFGASTLAAAQSPSGLKTVKLFGDCVSLEAPSEFFLMPNDMISLKYQSGSKPAQVLTNAQGSVNIVISLGSDSLLPTGLPSLLKNMDQSYRSKYPGARWNRSEMIERDGKSYFIIDIWTPAADTEIRNTILGTSSSGRLLMISFNVTRELASEWFPVGEAVMESVRVCD